LRKDGQKWQSVDEEKAAERHSRKKAQPRKQLKAARFTKLKAATGYRGKNAEDAGVSPEYSR